MYTVYIMLCRGGTLYTGIAKDVRKRFDEHRSGRGARYTRAFKPVRIVYTERKRSRSAALKREIEIQSWDRGRKLSFIRSHAQKGRS